MKKFFNKAKIFLFTWGKPIVAKMLKTQLVPLLQKKVNAGAIDRQVDDAIAKAVNGFCKDFLNSK